MTNKVGVEIIETPEYGVILSVDDTELADKFDDYLTEKCFVLFNIKVEGAKTLFYFGQASTSSKVQELYASFAAE